MSPEERRATIIEAALPLLAEHGTQVTTSQVATAASIAEGTVFRVFRDKQDLIDQCVRQALRPEEGLAAVSAVPATSRSRCGCGWQRTESPTASAGSVP